MLRNVLTKWSSFCGTGCVSSVLVALARQANLRQASLITIKETYLTAGYKTFPLFTLDDKDKDCHDSPKEQ